MNERDFRRENFRGDVAVVLADGQEWYFPEPVIRYVPAPPPERRKRVSSLGDEHLTKAESVSSAVTADDLIASELDLAAWMLLLNYDLTYEQIAELVQFDYREGADQGMRDAILEVSLGLGPKRNAVG